MKNGAILLLVIAIVTGMYSCRCKEACTSADYQYWLQFQGFNRSDLSPLVLKSYAKGSNFRIFRDSVTYTNITSYDTLPAYLLYGNDSTDYIISLPQTGVSYWMDNMNFLAEGCKSCSKQYQIHMLQSYSVDNVNYSNVMYSATPDVFFSVVTIPR